MTLNNSISINPLSPAQNARVKVQTWASSRRKNPRRVGQFSAEIKTQGLSRAAPGVAKRRRPRL
jgi:hypothetical protein